jgi:hypothetical protein
MKVTSHFIAKKSTRQGKNTTSHRLPHTPPPFLAQSQKKINTPMSIVPFSAARFQSAPQASSVTAADAACVRIAANSSSMPPWAQMAVQLPTTNSTAPKINGKVNHYMFV